MEEVLRQMFRDELEMYVNHCWTQEDVDNIISEAIRFVKKDDTFWECIDYALKNAIEEVRG